MIEANNLTRAKIATRFLKGLAKKTLRARHNAKLWTERDLSIALVGQRTIKELNKKYRKRNKPTDVLSFLYGDWGEIIICPEEVKKNAVKYHSTFKKELSRVLIHGIFHLLGYTHREMQKK